MARYDVVEYCPRCDNEAVFENWDVSMDGMQAVCSECGEVLMFCSMCDRSPCDWNEETGCKHSRRTAGEKQTLSPQAG